MNRNDWGPKMQQVIQFFDELQISYNYLDINEFVELADDLLDSSSEAGEMEAEIWAHNWLIRYQNITRH